jgi:lysozyme
MTDIQAMLIQQEGTGPYKDGRFFPYEDSVGKLTIGYGHNLTDKGLTLDAVFMQLNADIADALDDVRHNYSCYDNLSRPRQLVLISMAFNLGRDGLAKFIRFSGAVHRGDWEEAAAQIENSKAAIQAPARYQELARMMRTDNSAWI